MDKVRKRKSGRKEEKTALEQMMEWAGEKGYLARWEKEFELRSVMRKRRILNKKIREARSYLACIRG
jgi:hypothetical protein